MNRMVSYIKENAKSINGGKGIVWKERINLHSPFVEREQRQESTLLPIRVRVMFSQSLVTTHHYYYNNYTYAVLF